LLQYHLHVPGPDVLTNPDSEARQEYYGKVIRGTPTILFNGKAGASGGGGPDEAKGKFLDYQIIIDPLSEKPAAVSIQAQAVKKESPFPDAQRPMRLRDLSVVAFVQNDDTSEVLLALEVPVKSE